MGIDSSGESGVAVLSWWSSTMWAPAVAEPTPVGEIIYGAGCLILGIVAIVETYIIVDTIDNAKNTAVFKEEDDNDPYRRPNQKKQGRERKEKKKKGGKDWKPNPNKKIKPPKKHTPGRDHRKF